MTILSAWAIERPRLNGIISLQSTSLSVLAALYVPTIRRVKKRPSFATSLWTTRWHGKTSSTRLKRLIRWIDKSVVGKWLCPYHEEIHARPSGRWWYGAAI